MSLQARLGQLYTTLGLPVELSAPELSSSVLLLRMSTHRSLLSGHGSGPAIAGLSGRLDGCSELCEGGVHLADRASR